MITPSPAAIPVESRRQALDWSLVLTSQEIETAIDPPAEGHGWQLLVSPQQHAAALATLEAYRNENRFKKWLGMGTAGPVFDTRALIYVITVIFLFFWDSAQGGKLFNAGIMDNKLVRAGEWWRAFTAVTLHSGVPHLASNATIGLVLLGLAMAYFGSGVALLASFLGGVLGNFAGLIFYPDPHRSVGASGMVLAALGLLSVQSLSLLRDGFPRSNLVYRSLAGGVLLLVLLGFSPDPHTDMVAHLVGFCCGAVMGMPLVFIPEKNLQKPAINAIALLSWVGLLLLTWYLALQR